MLAASVACDRSRAPTELVYADRPIVVPTSAEGWRNVTVGGSHSCGVEIDGQLFCWGSNASAQLGVDVARGQCGPLPHSCEASPRRVALGEPVRQVSAGDRHSCAVTESGAPYCWGENLRFQAGIEAETVVRLPAPVMPTARFLEVAAGATHSCALRTNGVVYCWGDGQLGALGRGDTTASVIPQPIQSDEHFVHVSSGRWRSCAIAVDNALWCWGAEWESSTGNSDTFHQRLLPHLVAGASAMRTVSVAASSICGVTTDDHAVCWESNGFAQLGLGTTVGTAVPTRVSMAEQVQSVSAGIIHSCGVTLAGLALCWGNDQFGQLGIPRTGERCAGLECRSTPSAVFGGLRFRAVVTGPGSHSCGVTDTSALLCWGLGTDGQLGDGWLRGRQSLPVPVLAPSP